MRLYTSLCKGFQSHRFGYDKFVTYLLVLIKEKKSLYHRFIRFANGTDKEEQEDEVGETRHGEDTLSDPKIGTCPEFRVKVDEIPEERGVDETNLERKNKKRILSPKDLNLPLKKRKRSRRVTPNYRLIPEELRSPVSDPVLNNTYVVKRYDFEGGKVLTGVEEEMIKCEDQMYEADMLMSALRSAVDNAERVMRGEMRVEDLGVKFYRCIEVLYDGDMFEIVREDHQGALPVILIRLNQKLRELTVARERWKRGWKKTFKRLSPTQIDSVAHKSQVK
ncbi:PREDICTED: paired amphipathic helix protein Sin3-like 6 [Camelina sativa]|uniref:Paired amphipathic helix protein Sin3-like 6 n=1 Tax=Camelina sativa TaxID=90675 RepID=A0ABM0WB60_CAMSA|nr:PREDICTED: paired amphipathic helix protein Sin3-like 6 [Camelina sativa]